MSGPKLSSPYGGTDLDSPGTAGNVLTSDGTSWISAPPGNWVVDEVVAGSGNDWTLAEVPTGLLLLLKFVDGLGWVFMAKQQGSPAIGDYTISGTSITTNESITAGYIRASYQV